MSVKKISIGYSPCPNDTFIFYALIHNKVPLNSIELKHAELADVETLNSWAMKHKLDVTKLSFHAFGHVMDEYQLLLAGAALGRGCGPLIIAKKKFSQDELYSKKIAIPGKFTTATMLLKLYEPRCEELIEIRYDKIMESIKNGDVDCGVIIHESRFTYKEKGLILLQDLGKWWEKSTGYPIPLGCIVAKRALGSEIIAELNTGISESIRYANENPKECMKYIKENSQELDDNVIFNHIDLYVNKYTENIGEEGIEAVKFLMKRGKEIGVFPTKTLLL